MVTNATSLSRSGLSDWLIQRFSAVILGAYSLCLLGSFAMQPDMDYSAWNQLFANTGMRLFSIIAIFALCAHAWIGIWTITTDYLHEAHVGSFATAIRLFVQAVCALVTVVYLLWGIQIFWGS